MSPFHFPLPPSRPLVVGCFGDLDALRKARPDEVGAACDVVEIRLDLVGWKPGQTKPWQHLSGVPLLFTARRASEGGAGELSAREREALLRAVGEEAWLLDIELSSAGEMHGLIQDLAASGTPWLASYHDFHGGTSPAELRALRLQAGALGAAAFKAALELGWDAARLGELAEFLTSPGLPVALMGMGPLAPASRVLFAQLGSVLNYGHLGGRPTAPGQWGARQLREAIDATTRRPPAS